VTNGNTISGAGVVCAMADSFKTPAGWLDPNRRASRAVLAGWVRRRYHGVVAGGDGGPGDGLVDLGRVLCFGGVDFVNLHRGCPRSRRNAGSSLTGSRRVVP
jgi:hypothetical protein